jgi:hypothetical protein
MPSASMASMRSSTARTVLAFGVQQQARARLHAGDALRASSGVQACITMSCQRIVP